MVGSIDNDSTKKQLFEAAKRLFSSQGFDGTTVKEIADSAGVNISLVSYHFGGKEGIYRACIEEFGKLRLGAAQKLLEPASSVEELRVRLELFVEEFILLFLEDPEACKIIHNEVERHMDLVEDIFRGTFLKVFGALADYFVKAQKAGLIDSNLEPPLVAGLFFGSMVHLARMDSINEKFFGNSLKNPKYRSKFVKHLAKMCLYGVAKEADKKGKQR